MLGFDTTDTTTPSSAHFDVVVEGSVGSITEGLQVLSILLADVGQRDSGGRFLVHQFPQARFALHNHVGDVLLAAQSGKETHQFDGVNIVCNNNQFGLLVFDQVDNVVETVFDGEWRRLIYGLSFCLGLSLFPQAKLFLGAGLRLVLLEQASHGGELIFRRGARELCQRWGNLDSGEQNALLPLVADIQRPTSETSHIPRRLNIATDAEITRSLLEEVILLHFGFRWLSERSRGDLLFTTGRSFLAHFVLYSVNV